MSTAVAFALVCALHTGFQLTVTLLVYPVLLRRDGRGWAAAHARHSRTIVPVVGVVYPALLLTGGALVVDGPGVAGWVALGATGLALVLTAGVAAPLHGRLASYDPRLAGRLLLVDRVRCAAVTAGALAAVAELA